MHMRNPMVMLRDRAEETLTASTQTLGQVQQTLQHAVAQHQQLQTYADEYQQSLRLGMTGNGMSVAHLVNHQAFIVSLNQVVRQHEHQVDQCERAIDGAKKCWIDDKQRLNAFETLLARRQSAEAQVASRREQKLMDECAQRINHQRGRL
ncbi:MULTISPECIES: flagellar export protein FliJ [unclassified Pantoea]|uniref:flagellar export protein FliJ n=1 Tax=unclassified Pantoea TaxID=2630326 RepID=UPI00301D5D43